MVSLFYNKDPLATVSHMDSYFKQMPPDCSLFSEDGFEIPVHKEVLYQTEFMRQMLRSVNMDYCKIDILCQTVYKEELDVIVKFLYHGEICCTDHEVASQVSNNLDKLFYGIKLNPSLGRSLSACHSFIDRCLEERE